MMTTTTGAVEEVVTEEAAVLQTGVILVTVKALFQLARADQKMKMTVILVACEIDLKTVITEVQKIGEAHSAGIPQVLKVGETKVNGILEEPAVVQPEAPKVTSETRNLVLRINGATREVRPGHPTMTRWKKMKMIVRHVNLEPTEADLPEKMTKACVNYLRISSRICTGLKKPSQRQFQK